MEPVRQGKRYLKSFRCAIFFCRFPTPTFAKILNGLLRHAHRLGGKFHVFGLKDFRDGWILSWLNEIDKLEFQICLVAGKAKSQGKIKKDFEFIGWFGRLHKERKSQSGYRLQATTGAQRQWFCDQSYCSGRERN